MADKRILCAFGIDVDAVAGKLGSYQGEDSPFDISQGMFAGEIGTPRLLKLFDKFGIKTSWFVPGHSIETFPEQTKMMVDAGHEIGLHGYSHENPLSMTPEQEEAILDKCIDLITRISGKPPKGYVAPWWEVSNATIGLLLKHGVVYDHSLSHTDHECYYVRVGDSWTKIDYSKDAEEWMKPLVLSQLGFGNCLRKRLRLLPFFRSVDVGGWQPWDENGMWSGWKGKNETSWND